MLKDIDNEYNSNLLNIHMPRTIFENVVILRYKKSLSFGFCEYTPIRFFEILYIEKGSGTMMINEHNIPYNSGNIFIFIPDDKYIMKAESPTTVTTIKFLKSLFINPSASKNRAQLYEWYKKIEVILHSTDRTSRVKFSSDEDESMLKSLFNIIYMEYSQEKLKSELVIINTLHSILHIISRNTHQVSQKSTSSKIQDIINHIHINIYNPELITSKALAAEFNIAKNYFSQYFKKHTDSTLKKYILNYKINLAATRLKYTNLTLSEIALELGFTDSSHLDKTFVSYKGITSGIFRTGQKAGQ